jgi:Raf kinase inhibitor-like YbhB/YbcL family protein
VKKILIFVTLIIVLLFLFVVKNNSVSMKITSTAFENNGKIPSKYTCDGVGINPPLAFSGIPQDARSLVLIMDDPDAPMGIFTHWVLFNIDPKTIAIGENSVPQSASLGKTSTGEEGYVSVCPPSGAHRYFFKLYALDTVLNLTNPDKAILEKEMLGHVLEKAELIGLYSRN